MSFLWRGIFDFKQVLYFFYPLICVFVNIGIFSVSVLSYTNVLKHWNNSSFPAYFFLYHKLNLAGTFWISTYGKKMYLCCVQLIFWWKDSFIMQPGWVVNTKNYSWVETIRKKKFIDKSKKVPYKAFLFPKPNQNRLPGVTSPLLEAVLLPLIEQVCFRTAQIDNLWTTVSLQNRKVC